MVEKKWVYNFTEGDVSMKQLLGGKGANLCDMTKIGLPVPAGFTVTTEVCDYYHKNAKKYPIEMQKQIEEQILWLEKQTAMKFGDSKNPLLVSVRSGAAVSMPGMMDTILNLGLNDATLVAMINQTKNERFCLDSYRRFIQMFGDVVMEVEHKAFEEILETQKHTKGIQIDTDLKVEDLRQIITNYRNLIKKTKGIDFPQDVREQLKMAINAVFGSWNNTRAITYRRLNDIHGLIGTAVNVQAMVFGNMGNDCGTGVAFTRNPSTGENKFYGEYLINAQGEDVVAGIRTPQPVEKLGQEMPAVYKQLLEIRQKLERHYKDMQDIEFTVQKGKLYMLQTRNGKRTGPAAVRVAVELFNEKILTKEEALMKVEAGALDQLLHKGIDPMAKKKVSAIARGLPASPGAAVGKIVFNAEDAAIWAQKGEKIILVRIETSPEDIEGMHVSAGILTARGGMTSHAAVVARGMGKCCVAGCSELQINEKAKTLKIKDKVFKEGEVLTLDGSTGEIYGGPLAVIDPVLSGEFATLMKWARETKKLGIRTNADTPKDAKIARDFGAEGIGLTRTEHMFFEGTRINAMREMILADNETGRRKALAKLLPFQKQDFEGIFTVMTGLPVIIRFLDPPLHEFLPKEEKEIQELSKIINIPAEKIKQKITELHEFNPMLGFRGCRLGIVYPEISEMQARAVFEAALNVSKKGIKVIPEIEIPNVISVKEFKIIKDLIKKVAKETGIEGKIHYKVGTMIEFPRAAITADELATESEFMSFGTNDLTQTTLGFSRDDAGRFISHYVEKGVFEKDPFQTIDQEGVGKIMKMAISKARSVKPDMDIGICGEHGGDPASVKFCHKIGLSNVSCSPFRVPIATLAAAQASIEAKLTNSNKNKSSTDASKVIESRKAAAPLTVHLQPSKQLPKPVQQNNQQKKFVPNNNQQKQQAKPFVKPQQQNNQNKPQVKPNQNNQQKKFVPNNKPQQQNQNKQMPKQNLGQQKQNPNQNKQPQQKPFVKPQQQNNQQAKPFVKPQQNNNQQKPVQQQSHTKSIVDKVMQKFQPNQQKQVQQAKPFVKPQQNNNQQKPVQQAKPFVKPQQNNNQQKPFVKNPFVKQQQQNNNQQKQVVQINQQTKAVIKPNPQQNKQVMTPKPLSQNNPPQKFQQNQQKQVVQINQQTKALVKPAVDNKKIAQIAFNNSQKKPQQNNNQQKQNPNQNKQPQQQNKPQQAKPFVKPVQQQNQNKSQQTQKPLPKGAVSIKDEIKRIVQKELFKFGKA